MDVPGGIVLSLRSVHAVATTDRYNLRATNQRDEADMDNVTTEAGHTAGRSGMASLRLPPFLVGRSREKGILRAELAAACSGHGRLLLLGGEAGIGKTSLARDLIREAGALGWRVLPVPATT